MKSKDVSRLGYQKGSPYRGRPYLDINTPNGLIDMSNTDIPLMAKDETGYTKMLMPYSGMHKFRGNVVRETPMKKGGLTQKQYMTERGLQDGHNHGDFDNISPNQAREILHKKKVNGKPLTPEQYRLFGYLSKGNTLKYQDGGSTGNRLYDFLFDDDDNDSEPQGKKDDRPTAPSTDELGQSQDNSQNDLAMEMAMQDYPQYQQSDYQPSSGGAPRINGIDPNVMAATQELLQKYPHLQITSGIRSWGDKDAHPKGRAIDVAGPDTDAAYNYYRNILVPKYKFSPALNPNHGTGKHIHVGYYQAGGDLRTDSGIKPIDYRTIALNENIARQKSAPGSIPISNGYVTYPGDTLTNNQIPAAMQQIIYAGALKPGGFGFSTNTNKMNSVVAGLNGNSELQYKLKSKDVNKIDAELAKFMLGIVYSNHHANYLPEPSKQRFMQGGKYRPKC
jgi:hypothetical protein